ncbi:hypothetical protein [Pseudoduganella aquatica]|uniref:hypothetical protein n=1 Tax=Pseudoduganella aquatica TaxID=2660641 RepID=UPI001E30BCF8|nr:hypothetical protein [Pseudoduganella aquatica]
MDKRTAPRGSNYMKSVSAWLLSVLLALTIGGAAYADEPRDVSIIQLITNPELFDGKLVRVIGFMHLEFEGDAVYLHLEDFEYSMEKNSLAIELSDSQGRSWRKLNDHYVIIEGRFSATAQGHFGARAGSLQNVIRLGNWSVRRSSLKRDRNKLLAR